MTCVAKTANGSLGPVMSVGAPEDERSSRGAASGSGERWFSPFSLIGMCQAPIAEETSREHSREIGKGTVVGSSG